MRSFIGLNCFYVLIGVNGLNPCNGFDGSGGIGVQVDSLS